MANRRNTQAAHSFVATDDNDFPSAENGAPVHKGGTAAGGLADAAHHRPQFGDDSGFPDDGERVGARATSPFSTVPLSGQNMIDNELTGAKWGGARGTGVTLTYSFSHSGADYSYSGEPQNGYHALTTAQQVAARLALAYWSNVANIKFVEVADSATSSGVIRFGRTDGVDTAKGFFPAAGERAGDIWLGNGDHGDTATYGPNTYEMATMIHEIGHAIGLKHPHDDLPQNHTVSPPSEDWLGKSIMSYRSHPNDAVVGGYSNGFYPLVPMLNDVAAIQYLYGMNTSYHSGDDIYSWAPGKQLFETIWDTGGTDTIDWSNQVTDATISLFPGTFSSLGPAYTYYDPGFGSIPTTLAISYLTLIENARGGFGKDTIVGNEGINDLSGGAGNDLISGLGANDQISGDNGNDTLLGDAGNDVVYGGLGADTLEGGEGNDTLVGGERPFSLPFIDRDTSNDILRGGPGDDGLSGGAGNDYLVGGAGSDILNGGAGTDTVDYQGEKGMTADLLGTAQTSTGDDRFIDVENLIGSEFVDFIYGTAGANRLEGRGGNDYILGRDGADKIVGGQGADFMVGGAGADKFIYASTTEGQSGTYKDVISDFVHGVDKIDLAAIDAKATTGSPGDQAFTFRGTGAFTGIGQVHYAYLAGSDDTLVSLNTAGNTTPEMQIVLDGKIALTAADFVL